MSPFDNNPGLFSRQPGTSWSFKVLKLGRTSLSARNFCSRHGIIPDIFSAAGLQPPLLTTFIVRRNPKYRQRPTARGYPHIQTDGHHLANFSTSGSLRNGIAAHVCGTRLQQIYLSSLSVSLRLIYSIPSSILERRAASRSSSFF